MEKYLPDSKMKLNILLISTDKLVLDIYKKVFQKYGHRSITVANPLKAIQMVEECEKTEAFDLLFIEFSKYQMDKNEFEKRIHKINNRIKLIDLNSSFIYAVKKALENKLK